MSWETINQYKLYCFDADNCDGKFKMPIIRCDNYIPKELISFNYAKTSKNKRAGLHFYLDDYQFERLWNAPEKYIDLLRQYDCILSPDFSLYTDMPPAIQIYNVYRSRLLGQYYQRFGIKVIPTISWGGVETFDFAFDGIPKGSIVSISTVGVYAHKNKHDVFKLGVAEMIRRIQPSVIIIYGKPIEYDFGDIDAIYFENLNAKKFNDYARKEE